MSGFFTRDGGKSDPGRPVLVRGLDDGFSDVRNGSTISNVRMNRRLLLRRSLSFHLRSHLGVLLGSAVGAAVLIGALVVGDSVSGTLIRRASDRIGQVSAVLDSRDRFFQARPGGPAGVASGPQASFALRLPAVATRQDGSARAGQVVLHGVPESFWGLAHSPGQVGPVGEEVFLNKALARRLSASPGDELILRIHKPGALSQDAVITPRDQSSVAIRVKVGRILDSTGFGDLSFQANQASPYNAFLRHDLLARAAGLEGRANLALVGTESGSLTGKALDAAVDREFRLADAELELRVGSVSTQGTGGVAVPGHVDLVSRRIFLDPAATQAAESLRAGASTVPVPILTYLANSLEAGGRSVPYSMVAAVGAPYTPSDLRDDEIVVNAWLAQNLGLKAGDSLALTYYRVDAGTRLQELTNIFRVRGVVPIQGLHGDRSLMPEFPGLSKAESTHDWDAGFEMNRPIRDEDEAYWKSWRGTPKAFVTLAAGRRMWANRFGDATAIRWFTSPGVAPASLLEPIEKGLREPLDPRAFGLSFEAVRSPALAAATGGQDFGGLFIGFSLFLIVSAALLTALMFRFGVEQRAGEIGVLLALGWTPRRAGFLFLREGAALAGWGALLGAFGGLGYGRGVIEGLNTWWNAAVAGAELQFHPTPASVLGGAVGAVLIAVVAQWMTLRAVLRRTPRELMSEGVPEIAAGPTRSRRPWLSVALLTMSGGLAVTGMSLDASARPGIFFGAGFLALSGSLLGYRALLGRDPKDSGRPRFSRIPARSAARRPGRSTAVVALLSVAVFLIVVVAANRLDASRDGRRRESGTGGFAFWGSSALPVVQNLNGDRGREKLGLNPSRLVGVEVVPFRVRDGDEASCLNLNRAQRPRLLGVDPSLLDQRKAFTFQAVASGVDPAHPWESLVPGPEAKREDPIPAIGDANSIQWALGKKLGDTLDYVDERGEPFQVRLVGAVANSILQGQLLISEESFTRRFPGETGYRSFLVDAPGTVASTASAEMTRGLADFGFEAESAIDRLNRFNAVQNTYLNTFQMLGGLGLILGSIGMGLVVLRNVQERRGELGLLSAVGYTPTRLQSLVLREHLRLLWAGCGIGLGTALVAVAPVLSGPGGGLPWGSLAWILGGVVVNGLLWTWIATRTACRGNLLASLRGE